MLILPRLLANAHAIGPEGVTVIGGFCFLIGVWFSFAIFDDRLRATVRRGKDGRGPAMSPLGAGAAALNGYLLAAMFFAHAFGRKVIASFMFYPVFGAMVIAVLVALRDYARHRNRI
ncbi:MAG TPA: hypothetical protein VK581_12980 [Chthoniobacterales bacterium]|nr:hypothetical protein [Chthoniobacterales bacterium]